LSGKKTKKKMMKKTEIESSFRENEDKSKDI